MSFPSAGRLVSWAAVLPILAVPLAYGEGVTREYLAAKTFAALTASVVLAAAGAVLAGMRGAESWRPDRSGVYPVALVFLSWAGVSLFWHEHRWSAAEPLVYASLLLAGSWGLSRLLPDRRFRAAFLALYGVLCAAAAVAYLVSFRVGPHGPGYDFPFGNANVAAGFLVVPAVAAATFCADFRRRRRGPGTAVSFAVLAALVAAIVRSEAKAAWLGGLAGAWLGIFLVSGPRGRKASAAIASAAILLLVLFFTLVPARRDDLTDSIDVRTDIWRGTWRMISEGPIPLFAGRGPGSFLAEFPRHEPIESDAHRMWASDTEDPHSLPLAIWCETGLFGLVVFAALLATGAAAAVSGLSRAARPFDRASLAAAAGSLLAFVLAGSVDVAPHYAPVAMNAWIAVALLVAAGRGERGPEETFALLPPLPLLPP
ncbi:MAG: O-antigen ligase family protein, partial [Planctomycetes bacterium]|nr:O-antigen ligase family protein [Planctomycetota bacterium]